MQFLSHQNCLFVFTKQGFCKTTTNNKCAWPRSAPYRLPFKISYIKEWDPQLLKVAEDLSKSLCPPSWSLKGSLWIGGWLHGGTHLYKASMDGHSLRDFKLSQFLDQSTQWKTVPDAPMHTYQKLCFQSTETAVHVMPDLQAYLYTLEGGQGKLYYSMTVKLIQICPLPFSLGVNELTIPEFNRIKVCL